MLELCEFLLRFGLGQLEVLFLLVFGERLIAHPLAHEFITQFELGQSIDLDVRALFVVRVERHAIRLYRVAQANGEGLAELAFEARDGLAARRQQLRSDPRVNDHLDLCDFFAVHECREFAECVCGDGVGLLHQPAPMAGGAGVEVLALVAAADTLAGHLERAEVRDR